MNSLKKIFVLILGIISVMSSASATLITSFEGGSTLADNNLTLTQGISSRATIQSSVTSNGTTLLPTGGSAHVLKVIAGTEGDIINPAHPTELVTLVSLNNPVNINKPFLLMDFAFMNRDSSPFDDRQWIGLNEIFYDITGSSETGWHAPFTLGWQTLAIHFSSLGSVNLALGCLNDTDNAASSYCLWDNFRTADAIPTLTENGGVPVFSSTGIPPNITLPPPVTPVPEPQTWTMVVLGLFLTGLMGRARNQHPA